MSRSTTLVSVLAAVLVIAVWWLFLYSPGQERLDAVEDEIAAAEAEGVSLQQRVARLEAVRAAAPETEAAIAQLQSFVPDDPALPSALRQVTAAADDAGVTINQVTMTRPAEWDAPIGLYSSPLALTIDGSYFQVVDFLRRLEDPAITSRGIVLTNVTLVPSEYPVLSGSISGRMFSVLEPPPSPAEDEAPTDTPTEVPTEGAADAGGETS